MNLDSKILKGHFNEICFLYKEFKSNNLMSKNIEVQDLFQ